MWSSIISLKGSRSNFLPASKSSTLQTVCMEEHYNSIWHHSIPSLVWQQVQKVLLASTSRTISLLSPKKKKKRTISLPSPTQCYRQTEASNKTIIDGMKKILEGVMRNWLTRTSTPRRSIERLPLLWLMEWSHLLRIWIWICNSSFHTLRIQTPREYMYY